MKLYFVWTLDDDYYASWQFNSCYLNKSNAENKKTYILKHGIEHYYHDGKGVVLEPKQISFIEEFTEDRINISEEETLDSIYVEELIK